MKVVGQVLIYPQTTSVCVALDNIKQFNTCAKGPSKTGIVNTINGVNKPINDSTYFEEKH